MSVLSPAKLQAPCRQKPREHCVLSTWRGASPPGSPQECLSNWIELLEWNPKLPGNLVLAWARPEMLQWKNVFVSQTLIPGLPQEGEGEINQHWALKTFVFFSLFFLFLLRHVYCYNWPKYFNSHKDVSPPVAVMSKRHWVTSLKLLLTSVSAINTHTAGAARSQWAGRCSHPLSLPLLFYIYICKRVIRNKTIVSVLKLTLTKIMSCCSLCTPPKNGLSPEQYYPQKQRTLSSLCVILAFACCSSNFLPKQIFFLVLSIIF